MLRYSKLVMGSRPYKKIVVLWRTLRKKHIEGSGSLGLQILDADRASGVGLDTRTPSLTIWRGLSFSKMVHHYLWKQRYVLTVEVVQM